MTTAAFITSVAGKGAQATLMGDDDLFIATGVSVVSVDAAGVTSAANSAHHSAFINGTLVGTSGLELGQIGDSVDQTLVVRSGAEMLGLNYAGASLRGSVLHVNNAGLIEGTYCGVEFVNEAGNESLLTNTGTVKGGLFGVVQTENASGLLTIENHGMIEGRDSSFRTFSEDTTTHITNGGQMSGDIYFGNGDDVYDGRKGHIDSSIDGGDGEDQIFGGSENNAIIGGSGSDLMAGGRGDDLYAVDDKGDVVIEKAGQGKDTIYASVDFTLKKGLSVEKLVIGEKVDLDVDLAGNEIANVILGSQGKNVLNGGGGSDKLTGFSGHDTFVFNASLNGKNIDTITDFNHKDDTIWLKDDVFAGIGKVPVDDADQMVKMSKDAFWASGSGKAHDKDDRVLYDTTDGHLYYDADGTGKAKAIQFADLAGHLKIDASDFVLIA